MTAQANTTTAPVGISKEEADLLVPEHTVKVEMEGIMGRYWSAPMPDGETKAYIERRMRFSDDEVSDIDCAMSCPCVKLRNPEWFTGK